MVSNGLPPHDLAAEEAVLAALLLDETAISRVLPILRPVDFFDQQNMWVYEACLALTERGEPITLPTVRHELLRAGRLDEIGGEPALVELVGRHFTATGVEAHAAIVARDARFRSMVQAGSQIVRLANEGGPDAGRVLAASLSLLGGLVEQRDIGLVKLGTVRHANKSTGIQWSIPALDRYTMGLAPGEVSIVAGRVGSGKSMFAGQVARNCATAGGRAIIFTMEMSAAKYELRMAHAIAGVRMPESVYDRPLTDVEQGLVDNATDQIAGWEVEASEQGGVTVPVIAAAVSIANTQRHVDLIVVDYLQLMGMPGDGDVNPQNLKQTTGALKRLAVDQQCHVLIVSQMNRASQTEMRGKPAMSHKCIVTGESFPAPFQEALMGGAVEGDADLVVMLQDHQFCIDGFGRPLNHIEVCITKNRNGREGHGMLFKNYDMGRLRVLTEKDCFDIAGGDLEMARKLRIDSCYMRDDWKAHETAGVEPDNEPSYHNAYRFDAGTEALLNMAAALDPKQRRAQTRGAVEDLRGHDEKFWE